jgi:hypothetical protein
MSSAYAYPADLAGFAHRRWSRAALGRPAALGQRATVLGGTDGPERPSTDSSAGGHGADRPARPQPPDLAVLEELLGACYQASQMREEERPVAFRAILAPPECFPERAGRPHGLQRLEFVEDRPFNPVELRRLSVAADFDRTLIAARNGGARGLRVWGLLHQGPSWLRNEEGGRGLAHALPDAPVVHVTAAGNLEVRRGRTLVGRLIDGRLSGSRMDVFESEWLPQIFADLRAELGRLHQAARREAADSRGERWAPLDPTLERQLGEGMMKRMVAVVRDSRHGGTIIVLPTETAAHLSDDNPYLDLRYPFTEGPGVRRYRDLIVALLNRLAQLHGSRPASVPPLGSAGATAVAGNNSEVGWAEFETATDREVAALDDAIFEIAHLIASLTSLDGAVVLGSQLELLGFGALISGRLAEVATVARALDLEADETVNETTAVEGTRHRAAYRLAGAVPGAVVVVVSQDGMVRFVKQKDRRVTYWEHE